MNQERQNSRQRVLLGFGAFLAAAGIGFALVSSMLTAFPHGAKLFAILVGVVGIVLGLIVIVTVRARRGSGSTVVPALITLGCAFLLTGGSIVGFLATCHWEGQQDPNNAMFGWLVLIGAGAFVLALLWAVIAAIVAFVRARRMSKEDDSMGEQSS